MLNKMPARRVDNFLEAIHGLKPKCLIVGEPEPLARLEQEMAARLSETNGVYRSEAFFLELVPKGIDKAASLEALLQKLGHTREELIACGDGYNDLSMIRYAGLGVAMANAKPEVREAADFVTLSNEEDGVAYAVEKFIAGSIK
jgi:Cof subfamily protein (haloacid dehalogenase superfamily)